MVQGSQSGSSSLAADLLSVAGERLSPAGTPTSPPKTRVRGFRPCPSGRLSRRGPRSPLFTPGWRACAYKTASGRRKWLNRDPIGEVGFETVRRASGPPIGDRPSLRPAVARGGPNLYAFCHNRPTTLWDAYGLSACTDMCDQQYQANLASCSKAAKCVAAGLGAGGAVLGTVIWGPWGGVVVGGIDAGGGWLVTIDACVSGAIVARASCYLGCISVEW